MKIIRSIILATAVCGTTACNNEVFIKPLTVEPDSHIIEWTGGSGDFTANQDIDYVYAIVFRWANGRAYPLEGKTMQYSLDKNTNRVNIKNELCDITLSKDNFGRMSVESGYNLYADTIFMNIEISSLYETAKRGVGILPSPGFGHGEISYRLNQYWYEEKSDTITLLSAGSVSGEPIDLTIRKKGSVIAYPSAKFTPYDKLLSDNIFGRKTFEVDEVGVKGDNWGLTGKKIRYTSSFQHVDGDSIILDEDLVVTLGPMENCRVKAAVHSQKYGFDYSLPAISPIKGLADKTIDGVYWIVQPVSYDIIIQIY